MSTINLSNARMDSFIDTITAQVGELLRERSADILRAWQENIEEAQESEKKFPPLKLAITGMVDLEGSKIETSVRFTATYQSILSATLPDPDQATLPFGQI